jgi:TldD protein
MMRRIYALSRRRFLSALLMCAPIYGGTSQASDEQSTAPSGPDDVLTRAMVDELERSMKELSLGELPRPYFIQFNAQDRRTLVLNAAYGALLREDERHDRVFSSRVRVGSYELDNTNVGRPFGGVGRLPLDDDYTALRSAIWRVVDGDYKQAVEILTAKRAYLKDHHVEDRPDDYTPAEAVVHTEPLSKMAIDRAAWRKHVETLSGRFKKYPDIQDASVTFIAGTADTWVIHSEGTRLRTSDTGVLVRIEAELQADDGMPLADELSYLGQSVDELPTMEKMLGDIDRMCTKLIALSKAPMIDHYTGPVLLESVVAGQAIHALLSDRLCARPAPLGSGWTDQSFENRIGLRILPRSFQVYDDPRAERYNGEALAGAYKYDAEGVAATRVNLVEKGILKTLVAARAPTRKVKGSTGHGRNAGFGDARASVGCLYIEDEEAIDDAKLKEELLVAVREEGLEHGLRIEAMEEGGLDSFGDPIYAYLVSVEDGEEQLVRGLEFQTVTPRVLRRLLAAGKERTPYNAIGQISSTIIAPALLLEELDLGKTKQEFPRPPILPSPAKR